jgi:hypothetical protein
VRHARTKAIFAKCRRVLEAAGIGCSPDTPVEELVKEDDAA